MEKNVSIPECPSCGKPLTAVNVAVTGGELYTWNNDKQCYVIETPWNERKYMCDHCGESLPDDFVVKINKIRVCVV
jgi:hypothetical protein